MGKAGQLHPPIAQTALFRAYHLRPNNLIKRDENENGYFLIFSKQGKQLKIYKP